MALRNPERMTLEFAKSQVMETYEAGKMICNALSKINVYGYFDAPYYYPFGVEERPDGTVYVGISDMYISCKEVDIYGNTTYYGNKAGLEQFLGRFSMPKLITF